MNFSNFFQNMFVGGLGQNDDFAPNSRGQSRTIGNNNNMFVPNENDENANMDNFQPRQRTQNMQGQNGMQMPNNQTTGNTSFSTQNLLGNLLNMLMQLFGIQGSGLQNGNAVENYKEYEELEGYEGLDGDNIAVKDGQTNVQKGAVYLDENGKVIEATADEKIYFVDEDGKEYEAHFDDSNGTQYYIDSNGKRHYEEPVNGSIAMDAVNAGGTVKEKGHIYLDENGKVIENYKEPVFNGEVVELDIDTAAKIFAKIGNTSFQDEKEILLEDEDYIATGKVKVPAEWAKECGYSV